MKTCLKATTTIPVLTRLSALLGALVAGYQNRDTIAELFCELRRASQPGPDGQHQQGADWVICTEASQAEADRAARGVLLGYSQRMDGELTGGLSDLLRQFDQKDHDETAQSWVQPGEN